MSRNASASVAITANIQGYAQEISKIPDLTSDAALKAGAKLEAAFQKKLDAVAKEAREASRKVADATEPVATKALDAGRAISGVEGVGRIFGGTIGEVTGALGDLEAVFGALPLSLGAAGIAVAGLTTGLMYLWNANKEQEQATRETIEGLYDLEVGTSTVREQLMAAQGVLQDAFVSTRALADAEKFLALAQANEAAPAQEAANYARIAAIELQLKQKGAVGLLTDAERKEIDSFAVMAAQQRDHGSFMEAYNKAWSDQAANVLSAKYAVDEYGNSIYDLGNQQTQQRDQQAEDAKAREEEAKREAARAKAEADRRQRQAEAERKAAERKAAAERARADAQRKADEEARKLAQAQAEAAKLLAEALDQLYEIQGRGQLDFLSKEEAVESAYWRQVDAIKALAAANRENVDVQQEAQAAELAALGERNAKLNELAASRRQAEADAEAQAAAERQAARDADLAATLAAEEAKRKSLFETIDTGLNVAADSSALLQDIVAEFSQTYDTSTEIGRKAAKRQFAVNKAFAIADIGIKTAQAVMGFLAMVPPNIPGSIGAGILGATQAAVVAAKQPKFHAGRFSQSGNLVTDEQPAILRRGEVVVPSPMVASAGGPEAVRERLRSPVGSAAPMTLVADFADRRVTVPLSRAVRSAQRPGAIGWRR